METRNDPIALAVTIGSGRGWCNEPVMITRDGCVYLSTNFICALGGSQALVAMIASPHSLSGWPESPGRTYYRLEHVLKEVPRLTEQANLLAGAARNAAKATWVKKVA
jgi:hypothetical protein